MDGALVGAGSLWPFQWYPQSKEILLNRSTVMNFQHFQHVMN